MLKEDHRCRLCGTYFVPFKDDVQCPQCGVRALDEAVEEYFQFISELVRTMRLNKVRFGTLLPEQWPTGKLSYDVQLFMFEIFDKLEQKNPKDKAAFLKKTIYALKLEGGEALEQHLLDIALAVQNLRTKKNKKLNQK